MTKREMGMAKVEYALNVREKEGRFLYQVDCFPSVREAAEVADQLKINETEEVEIVLIEYDDREREISATSI